MPGKQTPRLGNCARDEVLRNARALDAGNALVLVGLEGAVPVGLVVAVHGAVGRVPPQAAVALVVRAVLHREAPEGDEREAVRLELPAVLQRRHRPFGQKELVLLQKLAGPGLQGEMGGGSAHARAQAHAPSPTHRGLYICIRLFLARTAFLGTVLFSTQETQALSKHAAVRKCYGKPIETLFSNSPPLLGSFAYKRAALSSYHHLSC